MVQGMVHRHLFGTNFYLFLFCCTLLLSFVHGLSRAGPGLFVVVHRVFLFVPQHVEVLVHFCGTVLLWAEAGYMYMERTCCCCGMVHGSEIFFCIYMYMEVEGYMCSFVHGTWYMVQPVHGTWYMYVDVLVGTPGTLGFLRTSFCSFAVLAFLRSACHAVHLFLFVFLYMGVHLGVHFSFCTSIVHLLLR